MEACRQHESKNKEAQLIIDRVFLVITTIYFFSYWFFSYVILQMGGHIWRGPTSIEHHPYKIWLYSNDFFNTLTYIFTQAPFYSVETWLMLHTDSNSGYLGYVLLHYFAGAIAILCLYSILKYFRVNKYLTFIALSFFVFNPFFYYCFSIGWYDFLSMCIVSILSYCFVRLLSHYSHKNLILFLCVLTLILSYRSTFHPVLYLIPVVALLLLTFSDHWRAVLYGSIAVFAITIAPYVKNYFIFDTFSVGIQQYALALNSSTMYFSANDVLLEDIKKGWLSPIILCFKQIHPQANPAVFYAGKLYSFENCHQYIQEFTAPKVKEILARKPYLATPAILDESNNTFDNYEHISNTIRGLVLAQELKANSKSFIKHHPELYWDKVKNSFSQLFRSNTKYMFNIAGFQAEYPAWFSSAFTIDYFKHGTLEQKQNHTDELIWNPLIFIALMCPFTFAWMVIGGLRHRVLLSALQLISLIIIMAPTMFNKMIIHAAFYRHLIAQYAMLSVIFIWSLFFIVPAMLLSIRTLFTMHVRDEFRQKQAALLFIVFTCLYTCAIACLIPSSEQERYRFTVEGLFFVLFLVWLTDMYAGIKQFKIKNRNQIT